MSSVFISHSSRDRSFVERQIAACLKCRGINPWYDVYDIQAGDRWERTIYAGLTSCDWFLVALSANSVASEWVHREVSWAVKHRRGRIIPVVVEDCEPDTLHLALSTIQHLDFRQNVLAAQEKLIALFGGGSASSPSVWTPSGVSPSATSSLPACGQPSPLKGTSNGSTSQAATRPPANNGAIDSRIFGDPVLMDSPAAAIAERNRQSCLYRDTIWTNECGVTLSLIPSGSCWIGSSLAPSGGGSNEWPQWYAHFKRPFWAATFPFTNRVVSKFAQGAWASDPRMAVLRNESRVLRLMRDHAFLSHFRQSDLDLSVPADRLNVADAEVICEWMGKYDDRPYRLPTEAEWEYLARAGATGNTWWDENQDPANAAVFGVTSCKAQGRRLANGWGMIDVLGNVAQWTSSAYAPLARGEAAKPADPLVAHTRVVRGARFSDCLDDLRLSRRISMSQLRRNSGVGVRVVCDIRREDISED